MVFVRTRGILPCHLTPSLDLRQHSNTRGRKDSPRGGRARGRAFRADGRELSATLRCHGGAARAPRWHGWCHRSRHASTAFFVKPGPQEPHSLGPPSGSVLPLVGHTASISDVQSFPCVLTDTQMGLTVARRTVPPGAAQGAARARGPARFLLHAQHGVRLDTSGRRFQRSFFAAAAPCHSTGRARSGCHHRGQAAAWPAQEPHPSRADRRRQSQSGRCTRVC